jgi:hypothetical protein
MLIELTMCIVLNKMVNLHSVCTESPKIFLPEERSRYPEHIFRTPFDQPDSLAQMVLYLCR